MQAHISALVETEPALTEHELNSAFIHAGDRYYHAEIANFRVVGEAPEKVGPGMVSIALDTPEVDGRIEGMITETEVYLHRELRKICEDVQISVHENPKPPESL